MGTDKRDWAAELSLILCHFSVTSVAKKSFTNARRGNLDGRENKPADCGRIDRGIEESERWRWKREAISPLLLNYLQPAIRDLRLQDRRRA